MVAVGVSVSRHFDRLGKRTCVAGSRSKFEEVRCEKMFLLTEACVARRFGVVARRRLPPC